MFARDVDAPEGAVKIIYQPPPDMANCGPLAVVATPEGVCYSEWMPTEAELARLNRGEAVRLWIWAAPIPPVALEVTNED